MEEGHRGRFLEARRWERVPVKGIRRHYWQDPNDVKKVYPLGEAFRIAVSREEPGFYTSLDVSKFPERYTCLACPCRGSLPPCTHRQLTLAHDGFTVGGRGVRGGHRESRWEGVSRSRSRRLKSSRRSPIRDQQQQYHRHQSNQILLLLRSDFVWKDLRSFSEAESLAWLGLV